MKETTLKDLEYARKMQAESPINTPDYSYWTGFCDALVHIIDRLQKQESPFKDIPNPLENEYIISG